MSENIVKKVCAELGITQRELAERIGMSADSLRTLSARARNLTLADKVISLEAAAKLEAKRVAREISSYKSQLSHKDAFIAELTHKLESRDKKINELATRIVLFDDHTYNPAFKELESLKDDMTNMHYKLTQAIIGVKEKLIARKD